MDAITSNTPAEDTAFPAGTILAPPPPAADAPTFDDLVTAYQEAAAAVEALPSDYTNDQADALTEVMLAKRDELFAFRAPNGPALLEKIKILAEQDQPGEEDRKLLLADARRLLSRQRIGNFGSGVEFGLCADWSSWARAQMEAFEASGSDVGNHQERADNKALDVLRRRATNATELAIKLRVAACRFFDADVPDSENERATLLPAFNHTPIGQIPGWVFKLLWEDAEELARRSSSADRSRIEESAAAMVNAKANTAALAMIHADTLVESVKTIIVEELLCLTTHDFGLSAQIKEMLNRAANHMDNLCCMARDKIEVAKDSVEDIENAQLVIRSKEGR